MLNLGFKPRGIHKVFLIELKELARYRSIAANSKAPPHKQPSFYGLCGELGGMNF